MDTLTYVGVRFGLSLSERRMPIEIANANRETLAKLFAALGFTKGAEVGVERAMYSEVLCRENPSLKLFCVDAWEPYRGYRDHVNAAKLERFYTEAQERMQPYPATVFLRKFSVEAAKDFADGSLDFVYLDGNHKYESVVEDLAAWARKVRVGGIVAGHDYLKAKLPSLMHVPQALQGWADAYDIRPWFVLGRQAKVEGELRDDGRSWFYVKAEPPARGDKVIKQ